MVFARFPFKKMLVFQAKHNFFTCPNERVRRQTHRKQFFMAFSGSFLDRKLQKRGKNRYNIPTQFMDCCSSCSAFYTCDYQFVIKEAVEQFHRSTIR